MRALVLERPADGAPPSPRLIDDHPRPRPAGGEALVRVLLAGICATDLELFRGYMDFRGVPGHEFVGVVEEGPDPALTGRRVVGEINVPCGACARCRAGMPRHCATRSVLGIRDRDGAFAEALVLPVANLHPVPDGVPDEAAVFTEPLAAAARILEQVDLAVPGPVVVLGAGRLGLLVAAVLARAAPGRVAVVGRHRRGLELARRWGAVATHASRFRPRGEAAVVVEATGSAAGLSTALAAVRPMGTVVLKTTVAGPHRVDLAPVVIDEVRVVGSRCGPFAPALDLLAHGSVDPRPMIDAVLPLDEAVPALERAARPGALKVLLRCG